MKGGPWTIGFIEVANSLSQFFWSCAILFFLRVGFRDIEDSVAEFDQILQTDP
jgi:hypothetical protein